MPTVPLNEPLNNPIVIKNQYFKGQYERPLRIILPRPADAIVGEAKIVKPIGNELRIDEPPRVNELRIVDSSVKELRNIQPSINETRIKKTRMKSKMKKTKTIKAKIKAPKVNELDTSIHTNKKPAGTDSKRNDTLPVSFIGKIMPVSMKHFQNPDKSNTADPRNLAGGSPMGFRCKSCGFRGIDYSTLSKHASSCGKKAKDTLSSSEGIALRLGSRQQLTTSNNLASSSVHRGLALHSKIDDIINKKMHCEENEEIDHSSKKPTSGGGIKTSTPFPAILKKCKSPRLAGNINKNEKVSNVRREDAEQDYITSIASLVKRDHEEHNLTSESEEESESISKSYAVASSRIFSDAFKVRYFPCDICRKEFLSYAGLQEHYKSHVIFKKLSARGVGAKFGLCYAAEKSNLEIKFPTTLLSNRRIGLTTFDADKVDNLSDEHEVATDLQKITYRSTNLEGRTEHQITEDGAKKPDEGNSPTKKAADGSSNLESAPDNKK